MTRRSSRNHRAARDLTGREIEILDLLAGGMTQKAVGARLGISHRTVEGHLARIRSKTGAASTAIALVSRARHARGARAERGR